MTERSPDLDQGATPIDIANLYSRAHVQGTRYWDFSASRTQVRGQFCAPAVPEPASRAEPEAPVPPPQQLEEDLPQPEPQAASEQVPTPEPEPQDEVREMSGGQLGEQPTPPGPTLWAGPKASREESGPSSVMQWPAPRQPVAELASAAEGGALPQPGDGPASRWYALQSVLAPEESPEIETMRRQERPPMLAVFSLAGGVGKTCLVATLGRALSALGERVLLADTAPYGLLPFYFGAREFKPQNGSKGQVRNFAPPGSNRDAPVHLLSLEAAPNPGNGSVHDPLLEELLDDGRVVNRILVDVATAYRDTTLRLLSLRPMVLVPILPDMNSVASLVSLEKFLANADGPAHMGPFYLLNQFDNSSPLHLDVREILRRRLGDRLLPFVLRYSSAVSEALAESMTVIDYAPGSAAAEDYWNLAGWLRSLAAPAVVGYGEMRWSER